MKTVMVLVFVSSLLLIPSQSFALSCAEPLPLDLAFDEYEAVLVGTVEKTSETNSARTLTLEVETSFKGVEETRITVYEDVTWGESQEEATYLFFLNREGGKWVHPLCSPTTHNTHQAAEQLKDREIIALQEVKSTDNEAGITTVYMLMTILLAVIAGVGIWKLFSKQRKNT